MDDAACAEQARERRGPRGHVGPRIDRLQCRQRRADGQHSQPRVRAQLARDQRHQPEFHPVEVRQPGLVGKRQQGHGERIVGALRRIRGELAHEAVAAAMVGEDVRAAPWRRIERAPDLHHRPRQRAGRRGLRGPEGLQQLVARDGAMALRHQVRQHVERPLLERAHGAAHAQFARVDAQRAVIEDKGGVGHGRPLGSGLRSLRARDTAAGPDRYRGYTPFRRPGDPGAAASQVRHLPAGARQKNRADPGPAGPGRPGRPRAALFPPHTTHHSPHDQHSIDPRRARPRALRPRHGRDGLRRACRCRRARRRQRLQQRFLEQYGKLKNSGVLQPRGRAVPLDRDADRRGARPRPRDHVRGVQLLDLAGGPVRPGHPELGAVQQRLGR